jgi:hypothetical protein
MDLVEEISFDDDAHIVYGFKPHEPDSRTRTYFVAFDKVNYDCFKNHTLPSILDTTRLNAKMRGKTIEIVNRSDITEMFERISNYKMVKNLLETEFDPEKF